MIRKLIPFLLLIILLLVATACSDVKKTIPFDENILLYYVGEKNDKGIYQFSDGQTKPELVIGDLPMDESTWASISPDSQFAFFPTRDNDYLVDLATMEISTFPVSLETNFEHYAAFSPDNSYLAIIRTNEDSLVLIDLKNFNWNADLRGELLNNWIELVPGRCATYECGRICVSMRYPFWINSDEILFFNDADLYAHQGFPDYVLNCSTLDISLDVVSAVSLDGTLQTSEIKSDRMDFWLNPVPGQIHSGQVLVTYPLVIDDNLPELVWWEIDELSQGIINPHPLTDTKANLFSLSSDGKLLRYNRGWEIINLFTHEVVEISKQPKNIDMLTRCDWHSSNGNIVCKGFTESGDFVLMLFSETLQAVNILQELEEGWNLIGFSPE